MKKIKQATALAAAAALSATMLAGCGGSTEGTASTATETASSASTAAESGNAGEFTYPMAAGHSTTYWCNLNENIGSYYKDMGESPFGKGLMENTGVDISRTASDGINEDVRFTGGDCVFSTDAQADTVKSEAKRS